ncbi:XVIPCD domain-containing protein [Variovorax sp. LT1R16]|uniref:XVIPCD domain-containing protein n=1 Tax=Variovorax sp. LT1R16 TaxID=3443728 RepID=UPI003F48D923
MNEKNQLSNQEARALAYFAVGVSLEGSIGGRDVSNHLSFAGKEHGGTQLEPVGNSGYSLGTLQTDLGAHPEVAQALVSSFQAWAKKQHPDWVLNEKQVQQTVADLGRNGNAIRAEAGRPLDPSVKPHLDAFLTADAGKTFVHERDERQIDRLMRPDSTLARLQATPLYQRSSHEDQARLSTIALKLENQTGGDGERWKKGVVVRSGLLESIDKDGLKSVDDVRNWVNEHLPKYVGNGVDHALRGTETFLRLERTDPQSDLNRAWQSVKVNATVNPGSLDANSDQGKYYAAVKDQFLHSGVQHLAKRGVHSADVAELQTKLTKLGYTGSDGKPPTADGHMGPGTRHAVKAFQHDNHLKEDGVAGRNTLKAIDVKLREQTLASPSRQEPGIQDSPLFKQAQNALQKIDAQFGRKPDQLTDNAAAAVAVAAQKAGLTRIDHLELGGPDNSKLFAAQGKLGTAHSKVIDVLTVEAMYTPITQSARAFQETRQAQQHAPTQQPPQVAQPAPQQTAPALSR